MVRLWKQRRRRRQGRKRLPLIPLVVLALDISNVSGLASLVADEAQNEENTCPAIAQEDLVESIRAPQTGGIADAPPAPAGAPSADAAADAGAEGLRAESEANMMRALMEMLQQQQAGGGKPKVERPAAMRQRIEHARNYIPNREHEDAADLAGLIKLSEKEASEIAAKNEEAAATWGDESGPSIEGIKSFGATKNTRVLEKLARELQERQGGGKFSEERIKLAQERLARHSITSPNAKQHQEEFDRMAKAAYVRTREEYEAALEKDDTIVISFVGNTREARHKEFLTFLPETYQKLRRFVYNIDDDHIKNAIPAAEAEDILQTKAVDEKAYITQVLVRLANSNDAVQAWLQWQLDERHPMYEDDGYTLRRDKLASDAWGVVELKGGGEVWFPKEFEGRLPILQDRWFFTKLLTAHLMDRRFMGAEFDMTRAPSIFGRILMWVQYAVQTHFQMVRPTDSDKKYFFALESEQPYSGVDCLIPNEDKYDEGFLVTEDLASILNNVPPAHKILRCADRRRVFELVEHLKDIKSVAATGGQPQNLREEEESEAQARQN